jgi:hypothetical protein
MIRLRMTTARQVVENQAKLAAASGVHLILVRPMSRIAATISILALVPGTTDAQLDDSHWSFSLESAYTFNVIRNPWFATFLGTYRKSDRNYNFVTEIVSARYAVTNPGGPLFLRGNLEMSGGLVRTLIVKGPESYFGGSILGLRYNFIQPGAKLIPYAELRAGGGWCDSRGVSQSLQTDFTFTYFIGVGLRYDVNSRCSVTAGVLDQHLSNAWLANPDYGVDSLGVSVGIQVRY